jgi:hypothetical protein
VSENPWSSFIEVAKGLAPQIQASADEIERLRRIPLPWLVQGYSGFGSHDHWAAKGPIR